MAATDRRSRSVATAHMDDSFRVRLISMPQDPDPIPVGTLGTVVRVYDHRDWFQIEVAWDNGRELMLAMPDDCVEVVGGV